ncbi:Protein SHOOT GRAVITROPISM like [Actinidia chinensis var. chinensis]|uniref:Protein SHOOT GRAVITROPISM like n=1 Tax=Actinidia chinensis var. chinensis TaxID=1590841 RepID=A0A2R6QGC0_ACTCC|nr:Protein SHOOT GRAVITROPISM like [Actinidia chinensis var. chinensis]
MEEEFKELQLLPTAQPTASPSSWPLESSVKFRSTGSDPSHDGPSLDLQLSISVRPIRPPPDFIGGVEALKWEAAEQIRLAAIEKAYAERVRELTRREMDLAQSEFARARHMWERAREEVDKAERMKEMATRRVDSTSMEITCQSCRQKFRPN